MPFVRFFIKDYTAFVSFAETYKNLPSTCEGKTEAYNSAIFYIKDAAQSENPTVDLTVHHKNVPVSIKNAITHIAEAYHQKELDERVKQYANKAV